MLPFLRDEFGNPSSIHSWARAPRAIAESTIRITFGSENTVADVDVVLAALKFALRKQKEV